MSSTRLLTQEFEYMAPASLKDALDLLSSGNDGIRILAGGQPAKGGHRGFPVGIVDEKTSFFGYAGYGIHLGHGHISESRTQT